MLDPLTLDQLRTFVAVVEEGSFSAAARRLRRVQSAVSHAMANLEAELGVKLWNRSTRVPRLTDEGRALLAPARRVCEEADGLRRVAEGLVSGLEPRVSLCVDAVFPVAALVDLCREFAEGFSTVELRVHTELMASVAARVLDGTCQLGVVGPAGHAPGLVLRHLTSVRMIPVVAKAHPLAAQRGAVPSRSLAEHVQIVLAERGEGSAPDQAVLSPKTWRIVDLHTKHELLRAGLGWGNMPEHLVREDLRAGVLVRIRPEAWGEDEHLLSLAAVHRPDLALGPASRWVLGRMTELCARDLASGGATSLRPGRRPGPRRSRRP